MTQNMTDQSEAPGTIAEMKEAVGSLFMLWSRVEADLVKALAELSGPPKADTPHGIGRTLAAWKALHEDIAGRGTDHLEVVCALHGHLAGALRVRNAIAHGLESYGIAGSDGSGEAYFQCRLKDAPEVITLRHLKACLSRLAGARMHISRLTYAALHPGERGLQSLYDDVTDLMRRHED
ncbi:hypothetical protein SAMN04488077_10769 [Roseovarius tolerans]|uniref:MAE-28990/MAE-18760-like HEPN domain-containing protein n=1 Tax=Roseovarius tolerans TaxID=74031 RepID=A0A1H8AN94_9RHOB|nr:hypothetical protein [Roseovarius tolerans]SEM70997.1 hypothetical protein SAMN04488077_10769 [Roseovarius tolerans]